ATTHRITISFVCLGAFVPWWQSPIHSHTALGEAHGFGVFDPDFAVFKVFFLPDGDDLLQAVNTVAAGFKGDAAVRRRDDDDDARFADLDAAQAVNDTDAVDGPSLVRFGGDLRHRL